MALNASAPVTHKYVGEQYLIEYSGESCDRRAYTSRLPGLVSSLRSSRSRRPEMVHTGLWDFVFSIREWLVCAVGFACSLSLARRAVRSSKFRPAHKSVVRPTTSALLIFAAAA